MNIENTSILFISLFSITLLSLYGLKDEYAVMLPLLALFGLLIAYGIFCIGGNLTLIQETNVRDNKKFIIFLLNLPAFVTLIVVVIFLTAPSTPRVAVTLTMVDQEGNPLKGTKIEAVRTNSKLEKGYNASYLKDENTIKIVRRTTVSRQIKITKDGYYPSRVSNKFNNEKVVSGLIWPFKHVEPWNPEITVALKKIKNPVALHAKYIKKRSLENGEYGFDLILGDWVYPEGKGNSSHITFIVDGVGEMRELTVKVLGENNGFQEIKTDKQDTYSDLKLPYNAPASGYKNSITLNSHRFHNFALTSYFFKVRKDPAVDDTKSFYGKIINGISFMKYNSTLKPELSFQYYLNPNTDDTNLEFDPHKNLFFLNTGDFFRFHLR